MNKQNKKLIEITKTLTDGTWNGQQQQNFLDTCFG